MTLHGSAALAEEARELETRIARLAAPDTPADSLARAELERRVLRLCEAAPALPPAEARQLTETLSRLVAALDAAADRLRAAGATGRLTGDSTPTVPDARRAAAAYGNAAGRRRRDS